MSLADAIAAALAELRQMAGVKQVPEDNTETLSEFPVILSYPDAADYAVKMHRGAGGAPVWEATYGVTFVWCDEATDEATNVRRATEALDTMALLLVGAWNRDRWDGTIYSLESVGLDNYGYLDDPNPRHFVAGLGVTFKILHNNIRGLKG